MSRLSLFWRLYAFSFQIVAPLTPYFWYRERIKENHYGYMPDVTDLSPTEFSVLTLIVVSYGLMMANIVLTESERESRNN
ncbi:MAG: hypothetical protein RL661_198 [Pseudomonadota bacterium]|jgi:hypothetical protein